MYSKSGRTLTQRAIALKETINKEITDMPWHVKTAIGDSLLAVSMLGELVADLAREVESRDQK